MKKYLSTLILTLIITIFSQNNAEASFSDIPFYSSKAHTLNTYRTSVISVGRLADSKNPYIGVYTVRVYSTESEYDRYLGNMQTVEDTNGAKVGTVLNRTTNQVGTTFPEDGKPLSTGYFSWLSYKNLGGVIETIQAVVNATAGGIKHDFLNGMANGKEVTWTKGWSTKKVMSIPSNVGTTYVDNTYKNQERGFAGRFHVTVSSQTFIDTVYGQVRYQITDGWTSWSVWSPKNSMTLSLK